MVKQRDEATIRKMIRDLILELAPAEERSSEPNPHLVDDLAYNSLALMELAFTIEDEFQLPPISQEEAQRIVRAKDVEDFVLAQLAAKTEPAASATAAAAV